MIVPINNYLYHFNTFVINDPMLSFTTAGKVFRNNEECNGKARPLVEMAPCI